MLKLDLLQYICQMCSVHISYTWMYNMYICLKYTAIYDDILKPY